MTTIKMLDTVEDSHSFAEVKNGKPVISYHLAKFLAGQVYDETSVPSNTDWPRRAQNLVDCGFAEIVEG